MFVKTMVANVCSLNLPETPDFRLLLLFAEPSKVNCDISLKRELKLFFLVSLLSHELKFSHRLFVFVLLVLHTSQKVSQKVCSFGLVLSPRQHNWSPAQCQGLALGFSAFIYHHGLAFRSDDPVKQVFD